MIIITCTCGHQPEDHGFAAGGEPGACQIPGCPCLAYEESDNGADDADDD